MKLIKESPLLFILICTGILYALLYLEQLPALLSEKDKEAEVAIEWEEMQEEIQEENIRQETAIVSDADGSDEAKNTVSGNAQGNEATEESVSGNNASGGNNSVSGNVSSEEEAEKPKFEKLLPLRSTTKEEYENHISADIYGDAGVLRAKTYEFVPVEESYFDDALFIGDSRTVGLHDYTSLSEHADFLCETSLTIHKVMEQNFKGHGTVKEVLERKDYGKIYISVGINELGTGTTEHFIAKYEEVIDMLKELEPEAVIFIQANMHVSAEKNESDKIFNNQNIKARNNAIATLADNETIFYIDVNERVCDAEGNLIEEYTFDQIHLLGVYNEIWKEYLLEHGIK